MGGAGDDGVGGGGDGAGGGAVPGGPGPVHLRQHAGVQAGGGRGDRDLSAVVGHGVGSAAVSSWLP